MKTDRPTDLRDLPNDHKDLDDLNFLREWREPIPRARIAAAAVGAVLYHLAAIAVVVTALNAPPPNYSGDFRLDLRRAVVLYTPPDVIRKPPVPEGADPTRSQPRQGHQRSGRTQRSAARARPTGSAFPCARARSGSDA